MITSAACFGTPGPDRPEIQILCKAWELNPSAIVVTDSCGNIEYVNPAFEKVTGYAVEEVIGKNPRILKSGNQRPEVYADLWRTITSGSTWTGRLQNRRKDGSLYWESLTIAPLCDTGEKIHRYIAVKKDVTAEEELQLANEKRYALTLEAVDDAVWDWNLATGTAFFSPKYYSMLGYGVGEFPAAYESWRALVHPEDLDRIEGELWRNIESGSGYGADIRMKSKSGEWIWISARGNIVEHDAQGKALRMMGTHTNITRRKRAEEALLKSSEEFRTMFELASIGMAQCDPQTGQWLRVNRKMCRITGYSAAEMLEMHINDITHPDDRQEDAEEFRRVVMGEAHDYRMEKRYVRKDGAVVWVNVNVTVIRDAGGNPVRTMAAIEDITVRKNIEDALRESERTLNEAQRIAQIGSYVTDIASGIWVASPTLYDIFGMDSSYVTNIENWGKLMAPGFEKEMVDYYHQVIRERGKFNKEYQVLRPRDGRTIWVSAHGEFTFDADGTPLFLKGTIQDITDRKRAEEVLSQEVSRRQELEQEVTAIAESEQRRIGHDLHDGICQELTGIQYVAELVALRLPEELPEKKLLAKTVEDIRKVILHTRQLSRALAPVVLEKGDISTALAELAANTESTFGIACSFSCPAPPHISSQETATHLYRIAQESIQNAIRHSVPTSIEIALLPSGANWVLQVTDNGTPSESGNKSGRGLQIMNYRASMIGGSIQFHRNAGTTVTCTFSL